MDKDKQYIIECTREQLMLIARCVEDCHRFASGETDLHNTICMLDDWDEVHKRLRELETIVSRLPRGARWSWDGGACDNDLQRRFIAQTYPIYREIYHFDSLERGLRDVYSSPTLTCPEGGNPIKIKQK